MFKKQLRKFRKLNKMTQEDLANRLYVSRTLINKWESGVRYPGRDDLKELANILGTTEEILIGGEEEVLTTQDELSECIPEKETDDRDEELIKMLTEKITGFLNDLSDEEKRIFVGRYYKMQTANTISREEHRTTDEINAELKELRMKLLFRLTREDSNNESK